MRRCLICNCFTCRCVESIIFDGIEYLPEVNFGIVEPLVSNRNQIKTNMKYHNSIYVGMIGGKPSCKFDARDQGPDGSVYHPIENLVAAAKALKEANAKDKSVVSLVYKYTFTHD